MALHLHDTATREVREFVPLVPGRVSIYHCGLTVQGPPHVGHIRKEVVFDVLRRWLEHSGYDVTLVANVTDIDDRVLAKGREQGEPWWAIAYANERELHAAYSVLGCLPPTYEPRATGHIPEMIELTSELLVKGHAYVAPDGSGDVYFDVRSWPAYGELSNQRVDDMEAASDADPRGKRDPRDFALWKGFKKAEEPATAAWPAPWGLGRPGWHLECSAMAGKYLGDEFDIHGGGLDLRFPHHENELAQSRAAGRAFARLWVHNAMVNLAGEKMSKSVGNLMLVSEVVKRVRPIELRYYLIAAHHRSQIEFTFEALEETAAGFRRIEAFLERGVGLLEDTPQPAALREDFADAMDADLSTPAALAVVHETVTAGNKALSENDRELVDSLAGSVRAMLGILGLDPLSEQWRSGADQIDQPASDVIGRLAQALLEQRESARSRRDYAAADAIRDRLRQAGIAVEDTAQGPRWTLIR